jgi:hypothetical protein
MRSGERVALKPELVEEVAIPMVFCPIDHRLKVLREKGLGKDREDELF